MSKRGKCVGMGVGVGVGEGVDVLCLGGWVVGGGWVGVLFYLQNRIEQNRTE
jgi:hypothetical protein